MTALMHETETFCVGAHQEADSDKARHSLQGLPAAGSQCDAL